MNAHSNSTRRGNWRYRIIVAFLGLACAVLLVLAADLTWTISSAEHCFRLVVGPSRHARRLYRRLNLCCVTAVSNESNPCSVQECSIDFSFEERLSWWGLIRPRRGFQGFVHLRNGTVETVHFFYREGVNMRVSVTEGPPEADPARPGLALGLSIQAIDPQKGKSLARVRN